MAEDEDERGAVALVGEALVLLAGLEDGLVGGLDGVDGRGGLRGGAGGGVHDEGSLQFLGLVSSRLK
ncbi:hypothetical protein [Planomonospora algeriensis]